MNADRQSWFRELEPPPGGPERLRQRLEASGRPASRRAARIAIAGLGVAALAVTIVMLNVPRNDDEAEREAVASVYDAEPFDRLLGRPLERTDISVSVDDEAAPVSRLETSNPRIRIYRID